MRSQRSDYQEEYARSLYRVRHDVGLLIRDIWASEKYNPKKLTMQRLSLIIKGFERKLEAGKVRP